jgi:hypothetical protein
MRHDDGVVSLSGFDDRREALFLESPDEEELRHLSGRFSPTTG